MKTKTDLGYQCFITADKRSILAKIHMTTFILPILYHHYHHHNRLNHSGSQAIPYVCIIARRKKDIHCRPVKPTIHYFCTIHNIHDMVSNP